MMVEYVDSEKDERTVNNTMRHKYRVLTEEEKEAMLKIKDMGLAFIDLIEHTVKGRMGALAITKMEEAVMWAVKGLTN
jgi:hypothetical protein